MKILVTSKGGRKRVQIVGVSRGCVLVSFEFTAVVGKQTRLSSTLKCVDLTTQVYGYIEYTEKAVKGEGVFLVSSLEKLLEYALNFEVGKLVDLVLSEYGEFPLEVTVRYKGEKLIVMF